MAAGDEAPRAGVIYRCDICSLGDGLLKRRNAMTTVYYADFGVRTRAGAYWMLVIFIVAAFNRLVLYMARTNDPLRAGTATVFLLALGFATIRALRELGQLEAQHSTPTDAMKLMFRLALTLPLAGALGLIIGLQ